MFEAALFRPSLIPSKPGIYMYRDRFGEIIYVGKARDLRKRMSQYFQPARQKLADPKFRSLINTIVFYEYQVVKTEDEALILESKLIKAYMPRYNILLRDDKRYQLIRMNLNDPFPSLSLCRFQRKDQALYWGPFPHGLALKETLIFLIRYFKLKSCKYMCPGPEEQKHCLAANIRDCCAPCVGKVSPEEYMEKVQAALNVLNGSITPLCEQLQNEMTTAAAKQSFEKAARLRDIIENLQTVFGHKNRNFKNAKAPSLIGMNAVIELQKVLHLPSPPRHIEGFDNSHISGHFPVSSMVCFLDGKPASKNYRHFKLKEAIDGYPDDYAAMKEVLTRHYLRKINEKKTLPDLILIDGGKGQLHAACDVLQHFKMPHTTVISLAKQNEEIFMMGQKEPILLPRNNPALRLLQAVRDESHRFVIGYNRILRQQKITESILDDIEGVGKERKQKLLEAFGSINAIRKSSIKTICERVPGIGESVATRIFETLKKHPKKRGRIIE